MQIGRLLHQTKALDGSRWRHNPSHAQPRKCHLGETVNMNDQIRTIQLFERRNALFPHVQPRIDMIFDDRHLVAGCQLQNFSPRSERHGSTGWILKIGSEHDQLDAIGG
jgi:hypothetical protein